MMIISYHMYCGRPNPQIEASSEVERRIIELLYKVTEPSEDRSLDYKMPPNGVLIHTPLAYVHVANGTIKVNCLNMTSYLKDTVNLESYLYDILGPALQAHNEENTNALREYYEDVFGISEEKEV